MAHSWGLQHRFDNRFYAVGDDGTTLELCHEFDVLDSTIKPTREAWFQLAREAVLAHFTDGTIDAVDHELLLKVLDQASRAGFGERKAG